MPREFNEGTWIRLLRLVGGWLPDDIFQFYLRGEGGSSPNDDIRLLTLDEAIEVNTHYEMHRALPGPVAWLWVDAMSNGLGQLSNYVGVFTEGPLKGFIVQANHEETILTPIFRSVKSFTSYLANETEWLSIPIDKTELPWEWTGDRWLWRVEQGKCETSLAPLREPDPGHLEEDRARAEELKILFRAAEKESEQEHILGMCYLCLKFADNEPVAEELRLWKDASKYKICIHDYPEIAPPLAEAANSRGDISLRDLVRLDWNSSTEMVNHLKQKLTGEKLTILLELDRRKQEGLPY